MKFIITLFILIFISGCEFENPNSPTTPAQSRTPISIGNTQVASSSNNSSATNSTATAQQTNGNKKIQISSTEDARSYGEEYKEHIFKSLDKTIIDMADQLFATNYRVPTPFGPNKTRVILTSFVDLDNFDKTTTFGRLLSESMFNELHVRKFQVTDFRGQDAVSVTKDGEFHITRDVDKLKDSLSSVEYILVGTYVRFEDQSLLINARILDSISGNVISSARVIYKPKDCKIFGICASVSQRYNLFKDPSQTNTDTQRQPSDPIVQTGDMDIVTDD